MHHTNEKNEREEENNEVRKESQREQQIEDPKAEKLYMKRLSVVNTI